MWHWSCRKCELSLIPILLWEGHVWTTVRSGLTRTLTTYHQLMGIPASLWWLWSTKFLQDTAFSPKLFSLNQPTTLQFNMAQEKGNCLSDRNSSLVIEYKLFGPENCYLHNLAHMKSPCVISDLFDETALVTDHVYLQLGCFEVIFSPPGRHLSGDRKKWSTNYCHSVKFPRCLFKNNWLCKWLLRKNPLEITSFVSRQHIYMWNERCKQEKV